MTLQSKPQKKTTDLQIKLLYTFAVQGPQSKSSLHRILGGHKNTIHSAIERLKLKEVIKFDKLNPKIHGSHEKLFKITDQGIEILSKDSRTTLEQFWEISFCVFDKKRNKKIIFKDFLTNYKKYAMKYDPKLATFGWGIVFNHFNLMYEKFTENNEQIEMLKFIASRKKTTRRDIILQIQKKYPSTFRNIFDSEFMRLIQDKLVLEVTNSTDYQISVFGILVLVKYYTKYLNEVSDGNEHKRIGLEITKIMNTSNQILPIISNAWNDLLKIIDTSNVLIQFDRVTLDATPISKSIQIGGMKEILLSERTIRETFATIMTQEYNIGLKTLGKLLKNKTLVEGTVSEVYDYLRCLGIINQYIKIDNKELVEKFGSFSFDENVENALANIISFEFFTNIIEYLHSYSRMLDKDKKDNMYEWIIKKIDSWNKFLQKHQKLEKWYNEWIEKITNFEKKNIEILEKGDFLKIKY